MCSHVFHFLFCVYTLKVVEDVFSCIPFPVLCLLCSGENVWEDIHPDSQEFIKEYLKQYPEVRGPGV